LRGAGTDIGGAAVFIQAKEKENSGCVFGLVFRRGTTDSWQLKERLTHKNESG